MTKKQPRSADRHKPSRNIRLRERLADQLQKIAERDDSNITEQANNAVREYLEKRGFWPPSVFES